MKAEKAMTGDELLKIRRRLAMTQRELGEVCGVRYGQVIRWEKGQVPIRAGIARLVRMLDKARARAKDLIRERQAV